MTTGRWKQLSKHELQFNSEDSEEVEEWDYSNCTYTGTLQNSSYKYKLKISSYQHECPEVKNAGKKWFTWLDVGEECPCCKYKEEG